MSYESTGVPVSRSQEGVRNILPQLERALSGHTKLLTDGTE